jgi:hypothetical protein
LFGPDWFASLILKLPSAELRFADFTGAVRYMRILPFCSTKSCIALQAVLLFACFCAVHLKAFETSSLAAPLEARTGKNSNPKSATLKADQTISFQNLSSKHVGDAPFQVSAVASSGLAVTLFAAGHCSVAGATVQLTGVGSCTLIAIQDGNDEYNAATSVSRSFFIANPSETVVDLNAFGATGDGTTDDAPAFQQALDALANAGGGTLFVPPGRYALVTPVSKNFTGLASAIAIRGVESETRVDVDVEGYLLALGLDLASEVYPRTDQQIAIDMGGLKELLVADIAFVGTPDIDTDALATLSIHEVDDATIYHCEFYGLRTLVPHAGVVLAIRSGLRIEQTKFLGSFGFSAVNTPVVQNLEWKNVTFSGVAFVDYGMRPELFCKCESASYAWVNVGNAAATSADSPRREASFTNVFMDEGAFVGLFTLPSFYEPPSAPIDLIYISGLTMNVSNLGTTGNHLSGLQHTLIEKAHYEWSQNADSAVQLSGAGNAIIDQTVCTDGSNRIAADSATEKLTVINSTYVTLDSQAQVTRVLTVSPDEDPVQYVRKQFEQTLGRAPDPAAHFYWSDLLLQCGDDSQCIDETRGNLGNYLNTGPSPNFSIDGQIKNDHDAPLVGTLVALSGSQSVVTQTDGEGRYSFAGLPTSGVYTVTPSQTHYTFADVSRTLITPASDQTIDFAAAHHRFQISGRVADGSGQGIEGAAVELSGSGSLSTMTDVGGNYLFNIDAEGDYTVTTSKAHYSFSPAAKTLTNLTEDQITDFTGTLANYVLGGQVKSNGAGLSGVTVTLGGSQTGTTTTDSNGNFSFNLPATGSYTVTPSLNHFLFTPQQLSYPSLSGNSNGDFVALSQSFVEFSNASYTVSEGTADAFVTVIRSGDTTGPASVAFETLDSAGLQDCNITNGTASPRCDFNFTVSRIQFAPGETSKTVSIAIIDGAYAEGNETFTLILSNPSGAEIGAQASATVTITDNDNVNGSNPAADADFFIRQHYLDFLGREPDQAGYDGWRNILNNCGITVPQPCDRIEVSSAFFRSPEFQGRGYFVYKFYASVGRVPHYDEFAPDLAVLSGFLTPEELEANKITFTNEFMDRPEFRSRYDGLATPVAYVDGLLDTVGLANHPSRQAWIDGLTSGSLTRAQVLRALVDSSEMYYKYYNEAFVVMQYFGYLRRTADASYLQWIQTMNANGGDYRIMVNGFLNSTEYRQRFGP